MPSIVNRIIAVAWCTLIISGCDLCFDGGQDYYPSSVAVLSVRDQAPFSVAGLESTFTEDSESAMLDPNDEFSLGELGHELLIQDFRGLRLHGGFGRPTELPDSVIACTHVTPGRGVLCTTESAGILNPTDSTDHAQIRWTSLVRLHFTIDASAEQLLADDARLQDGDKYRITRYASPTVTPDGVWLAAWARRETRKFIRDAEGTIVREIRYAADPPEIVMIRTTDGSMRRVEVPLDPAPNDPPAEIAIAEGGERIAVAHAGRTVVLDVENGDVLLETAGHDPHLSRDGNYLAVRSESSPNRIRVISLTDHPKISELDLPTDIHSILFTQNTLFAAGYEHVYAVEYRQLRIADTLTLQKLQAAIGGSGAVYGQIVGLANRPIEPSSARILIEYTRDFPSGCD